MVVDDEVLENTKNIKKTIGDKTFILPRKIPYPVLRWFTRESAKEIKDPTVLMEGLFMRVVISPKITEEYLETEANADDFTLMNSLIMDVSEMADDRVYTLKKKLK
jgi:hypothetical protein